MRIWKLLPGTLAVGLMSLPASAADPIGAAVLVVNQVTAELASQKRPLAEGGDVHQDELIEVAADASSELELNDETKMALGPGSKLLLDKFVYDPSKTQGSIAINLVKGTFRFVTGVAAKPNYVVRVPQASITVRGTIFDVFVQDNGVSWLLLHEGAVKICNERGTCRELDEPGKLIRITDGGEVGPPTRWAQLPQKTANFGDAFPFVENPPIIDPSPVLTREAILLDVDIPIKKKIKKVKYTEPTKDRDDDPPKRKKRDRAKKHYDEPREVYREPKRKRRYVRDRRRNYANEQAIKTGIGIAIGIGALKYGRGHGGHNHGDYGGRGGRGRY